MKNLTTILLFLIAAGITDAQNIPTYCITFGNSQSALDLCGVVTYDGGYILGGISYTGGNGQQNYIAKYDGNGNIAWQHEVGSGAPNDFNDVTETSDHHIIVTGYQGGKMIVIKYTADGVQVWAKELSVLSTTFGQAIIETSAGNLLITGTSHEFSDYYTIVIKLDSDGNLIWNKNFDVGFDTDDGYSCVETADDKVTIKNLPVSDFLPELFVTDLTGKEVMKVLSDGFHSGKIEVNTSGFPSSTYLLVLKTSEKVLTQKFIVQH